MFPEICTIGPFTVYSYGLMLVMGFVVASWLACQQAKRLGLNPDTIFNMLFMDAIVCMPPIFLSRSFTLITFILLSRFVCCRFIS